MARMYSRRKGKSKSTRPVKKAKPAWLRYQQEEVEQLILKLAKSGKSQTETGVILRDSYGIPDVRVVLGKRMGGFLREQKVGKGLPEDLIALIRRDIFLMKHMEQHKKDMTAKRGMMLTESKIGRLVKYYKAEGVLPESWRYSREQAQLLVGS